MSSHCSAIPVQSAPSDSRLVAACLAHIRADARLDDEPVLPSLDDLLGKDPVTTLIVTPAHMLPKPQPTADAIVMSVAKSMPVLDMSALEVPAVEVSEEISEEVAEVSELEGLELNLSEALEGVEPFVAAPVVPLLPVVTTADRPLYGVRTDAPVVSTSKSLVQRMVWPVFLCGFVAGIFGGVAVMKSPVGEKPAVQHVVKKVHIHGASVYAAAAAATSRLAHR